MYNVYLVPLFIRTHFLIKIKIEKYYTFFRNKCCICMGVEC